MDGGFGDDEAYNVYDKAWRADKDAASHIYRPSRNKDKETYGDDLDELIKTNRSDVFLEAFVNKSLCAGLTGQTRKCFSLLFFKEVVCKRCNSIVK